jgi:hypothetical protein
MKTLRLFTIILLAALVISTWAPAPVYAKSFDTGAPDDTSLVTDLAKTKLAKLRVTNKTGGTLYISFSGPQSYSFSTSKQGKTTFEPVIKPGKYTVSVHSSGCSGNLSYKRNVKGGTVNLPPFVCKTKKKK